jgi:hypothetical protein
MKTIIHTADIARPREAVFGALTTVPALSAWWTTKVTGDAGPEGRLSFTFAGEFNPVMQVVGFAAPARLEWECVDGVEQWRDNTSPSRAEIMAERAGFYAATVGPRRPCLLREALPRGPLPPVDQPLRKAIEPDIPSRLAGVMLHQPG